MLYFNCFYFVLKKISLWGLILISLFVHLGCTSQIEKNEPTGFIGKYHQLTQVPDSNTAIYKNDYVDWQQYTAVIIDPIQIYVSKNGSKDDLEHQEIKKLSEYFRTSMIKAMRDRYTLVDKPGPSVLRVKIAITDLKPINVAANILAEVLISVPVDFGEAAIEGEIIDSNSNERLFAITDRKMASVFSLDGSLTADYTKWGHVEDAFDMWAKQFRQVLDGTQQ